MGRDLINWFCLCAVLILSLTSCNNSGNGDLQVFRFSINGIDAECLVACTKWAQIRGLSGKTVELVSESSNSKEKGMCFFYPRETIMVFTMADVPEPLDLVLLSSEGKVIYTTTMKAMSKRLYSCNKPARIALEFRKGLVKRALIRPGQQILSSQDISDLELLCGMGARKGR